MKRVIIVSSIMVAVLLASCGPRRDYNEWLTVVVKSTPDSAHLTRGMLWGNSHVKLIGTINARDFDTLRAVPTIYHLDLSEVRVVGQIIVAQATERSPAIIQTDNAIPVGAFGTFDRVDPKTNQTTTLEAHKNLRSILFPKTISSIGKNAFSNCGLNRKLELPASLLNIYDSAFNCCGYLVGELNLPQGLLYIGGYAFNQCPGISGSVTLPSELDSIGSALFMNCGSITGVTLPRNVRRIGKFAFAATSITSIELPNSLEQIDAGAFRNCQSLSGLLDLPASLRQIGRSAFAYTNVESIDLNWTSSEMFPRWDTASHWFPAKFEVSHGTPQYNLYTPKGALTVTRQHFTFEGTPYYNIAEK